MALIARTNPPAPVAEAGAVLVWRASQPTGHPDLVLARAVREGVIDQTAAQLIGDTRLEDQTIRDIRYRVRCHTFRVSRPVANS